MGKAQGARQGSGELTGRGDLLWETLPELGFGEDESATQRRKHSSRAKVCRATAGEGAHGVSEKQGGEEETVGPGRLAGHEGRGCANTDRKCFSSAYCGQAGC